MSKVFIDLRKHEKKNSFIYLLKSFYPFSISVVLVHLVQRLKYLQEHRLDRGYKYKK